MSFHIVEIKRVFRRVRGGSQAQLVQGSDNRKYIAKFQANPQGTRTLINEWIGHWFFRRLGITTPEITVLHLSPQVADKADLHFQIGNRKVDVAPGRHLGSLCPVNPETAAIFDFLPNTCLHRVINAGDFGKALVIDSLLGHTDSRQCIFVKDRTCKNPKLVFRAHMIDHGGIFGGSQWTFQDPPAPRGSLHPGIYPLIDMAAVSQWAIQEIGEITAADLLDALRDIPGEWFVDGDREALENVCAQVLRRVDRLESLLQPHLQTIACAVHERTPKVTPLRKQPSMRRVCVADG